MIVTPPARHQPLFDLAAYPPASRPRAVRARIKPPAPRRRHIQRRLWLDVDDVPPSAHLRDVPRDVRPIRLRLTQYVTAGVSGRTHEQGQRLLPLVRRVTYTTALCDGSFRLFLEYRPEDTFPHYRLMWGDVLWGRARVWMDTDLHGANIWASPALPLVQSWLADYLAALGYRPETARLLPHDVMDEDDEDEALTDEEMKLSRDYHLFKVAAPDTRKSKRKR